MWSFLIARQLLPLPMPPSYVARLMVSSLSFQPDQQTNKDAIVRAKSLLDNVDARVLGALLNNLEIGSAYGSSYYYYYHYYQGGHPKKGKRI